PDERGMGNAILQSGASLGSIALPVALQALPWLFDEDEPSTWRRPFLVIGALGALWALLWWAILRPADLAHPERPVESRILRLTGPGPAFLRRFLALVALVVAINMTWHCLRAWGPPFLQEIHKYNQSQTNNFTIAYYATTFVGVIAAGAVSLWLAKAGL